MSCVTRTSGQSNCLFLEAEYGVYICSGCCAPNRVALSYAGLKYNMVNCKFVLEGKFIPKSREEAYRYRKFAFNMHDMVRQSHTVVENDAERFKPVHNFNNVIC